MIPRHPARRWALFALAGFLLGGCPATEPGPDNTPASITISPSPASVDVGSSVQLTATVKNSAGSAVSGIAVSFSSGNSSVASTTTSGSVTGVSPGTATISASGGGAGGSVTVTVTSAGPSVIAKTTDLPTSPVVASPNTIVAQARNAAGSGVPGVTITFAVTAGGGSVSPTSAVTNATGMATTVFTMGTTVGVNTATASTTGAPAAAFSATSVAGPAAALVKSSTDPTSLVAGETFGTAITARVNDAQGNAKSGVTVNFAVTAGGGTMAPASAVTNASGQASAVFTTNKTIALNTATASVTGITNPVSYSITTIGGPATTLTPASRLVTVGVGATAPAAMGAKDVNGNATTATVTYTSRTTAAATVASTGTITGVAAGQSMVTAAAGNASDSVLAVVRASDGLVLMTDLANFGYTATTDVAITIILDASATTEKVGSTSVKIEWDTTAVKYQSHAAVAGGPTATVNSTSSAAGSLTLSIADATGYSGKVNLLRVTLKTTTAGKAGSIKLSASEVTGAVTFTNLLPKTIAVTMPIIIR